MAQHGYLREYDEAPDRSDDGDRRDRGFMFDDSRSGRDRFGDGDRNRSRSGGSDWDRAPRNFSAHPDDHYRSWRDKQMQALDRDYEEYCREREQQFHQEFDSWRSNRNRQQPMERQSGSSEEIMELSARAPASAEVPATASPVGEATLGTNNSENSRVGPGKS